MATPLLATALNLADHQGKSWRKNIKGGVLAQLTPGDPELKVGATDFFTFTGTPKAELVGEGANKSSQDGTPTQVIAKTYKVQVTYRFSQEVMFMDEDSQTQVVDNLVANVAVALSRALDLLAIHGINPATGVVSNAISNYFVKAGNGVGVVPATSNAQTDIESAAALLQGYGYNATGIALDPAYAGKLARSKDSQNRPLYPELGLGFNVESFQGLNAASSDTVSGRNEVVGGSTNVQAIVGDWSAFKWGIARELPLETIQYGDPDGNGDLKRTNEIAVRAESYIGFAIFDGKAFAMLTAGLSS